MDKYKELVEYLGVIGHPVINFLNNSLPEEEVQSLGESISIELPQILIDHFKVHNGVKKSDNKIGELSVFPGAVPLSIKESIELYQENLIGKFWPETFYPIFESTAGDYYFIQLNPEYDFGMIYYYSPGEIDFDLYTTCFDSYESMIDSIYQSYQKKYILLKMDFWKLILIKHLTFC